MYSVSAFNPIFSPSAVKPASNKNRTNSSPSIALIPKNWKHLDEFFNRAAKKVVFRQNHLSVHWGSLARLNVSSFERNATLNGIQKPSAKCHDHGATQKTHGHAYNIQTAHEK